MQLRNRNDPRERVVLRMRNMHFVEIEKLRFNYDARNARY